MLKNFTSFNTSFFYILDFLKKKDFFLVSTEWPFEGRSLMTDCTLNVHFQANKHFSSRKLFFWQPTTIRVKVDQTLFISAKFLNILTLDSENCVYIGKVTFIKFIPMSHHWFSWTKVENIFFSRKTFYHFSEHWSFFIFLLYFKRDIT